MRPPAPKIPMRGEVDIMFPNFYLNNGATIANLCACAKNFPQKNLPNDLLLNLIIQLNQFVHF